MNKKNFYFPILLLISLLLSSCFKKEVVKIPPVYEKIDITETNMISNYGTGEPLSSGNKILSFELQNNKFIIDKDLNNFNDKYSYILKSKDLQDNSYVGFKIFNIDSIEMDYKKDIERELQTKINYTKKSVDLGDCVINKEQTEKGIGFVYTKKCDDGKNYLIQLTSIPTEGNDGKIKINYKAYELTKEIKDFLIKEYFDYINNIDSFDLSFYENGRKTVMDYTFDKENYNLPINGIINIKDSGKKKINYYTKRIISTKGNIGVITDVLITKPENFNLDFDIIKNIEIFEELQTKNFTGNFINYEIFKGLNIKYNAFLLFKKEDKNIIEFIPRFPKTLYIKVYTGKNTDLVNEAIKDFKKNFSFKKGYLGSDSKTNVDIYSYHGDENIYLLIVGKNQKDSKEYAGKYIYAKINKNFISTNTKTYLEFIGKIK